MQGRSSRPLAMLRGYFRGGRAAGSRRFVVGIFICILLSAAQLLTAPARAELLLGIKAGRMDIDMPARNNPWNIAAHLGFQLDNRRNDLSLVGEVNRTVDEGRVRGGGDLEFESEAVFLRARTTSSLFASFRFGIVRYEIVTDGDSRGDDGLLLGGGVGVIAGRTRIQLEFTSMGRDADFLSLNIEF